MLTLNCAVGGETGCATLTDSSADDQNRVSDHGSIKVPMRTLDRLVPRQPIKLLKVDVEGYERYLLNGARETLARTEYVLIEVSDWHFASHGYTTGDVIADLQSHGFRCARAADGDAVTPNYSAPRTENLIAARHADPIHALA